ncbi:maleylpyruvate isomerase family mycothiol-dependent enzyme [Kribbella sp. NPDC048915]|uniref:maleylpyruvate isomerase family mycothiol-dependent enzyme n=1 Tax=Kribbella sp. NPDC048915 TaxID=3155148 RepID=UPI0033F51513
MDEWNGMSYAGKETLLRVVRQEAELFFGMVEQDGVWEAPTGAGHWEVRDVVAHLTDTTESYFVAFDAARSQEEVPPAYGLPGMAERVDKQALALRGVPQAELIERLRTDFDKMMGIFEALRPDDWGGFVVPHFYMGPLPAFFFPAFQLMDYGVHSWDIRQGTGRAHGLSGEAADLLVPFMFVLWKYTTGGKDPCELGIRITSGPNAGDTRVAVGPDGMDYAAGEIDDLPAVIEFDPGSFVLTAFGRSNAGTIRGDRAVADRYLNLFFRI